ncbi:MAG: endonuclease V [Candidatus Lokiarchaeota archaeon]
MRVNFCNKHQKIYYYVCPECLKPYLKNTIFSDLNEVRDYQILNSQKIIFKHIRDKLTKIGLIKTKLIDYTSYSLLLIINLKNQEIEYEFYTKFRPKFPYYFPSVLFLRNTEIYLDLLKKNPFNQIECLIVNSSGLIHPYHYGCACDFGLKTQLPVIGYTKSLLYGKVQSNNSEKYLKRIYSNNRPIGYAIPKSISKSYYYISVGNNIDLKRSKDVFQKIDYSIFGEIKNRLNRYVKNLSY